MTPLGTWSLTVLLAIGGYLLLNHLGVDLGSLLSATFHGLERALGQPL
jgi:hypothetical protein